MADTAVVVGGGLAGIAAALRLSDSGRSVTLLERRPRLGGAAFSFRRGELTIDNGQHVFLRCCTAYRELVERLGAAELVTLQDRLDIPVLEAGGRSARLRRARGVPAPLHLTAALARYALLSLPDRARAARGALALRGLDPADRSLDALTLGDFLRRHGQNDATIDRLWGIIAVATLNLRPDDASLALAAKVFRTGLLDTAGAADVGYAAVPLGDLHSTAARARAGRGRRGGAHRLPGRLGGAARPRASPSTRPGRTARGRGLPTRSCSPLPRPKHSLPRPASRPPRPPRARGLGESPIVNVHVIYDRKVTDLPFAAAVGSPVQWIFDRTEPSTVRHQHRQAQYLAITVSAADTRSTHPAECSPTSSRPSSPRCCPARSGPR